MILVVAATQFEMDYLSAFLRKPPQYQLICGVGPVESCFQLTRYLEKKGMKITQVINFGVGGAYSTKKGGTDLLDICLASSEVLGDAGICYPMRIDDLPQELMVKYFDLQGDFLTSAERVLRDNNMDHRVGPFVTVSCVSGTDTRGALLHKKYLGICENMEGAALARVCQEYETPLLQVRCISNMVENRSTEQWMLKEAAGRCGEVAALLFETLGKEYGTP